MSSLTPGTYHAQPSQGTEQEKMDYALNNKRRVVRLVLQWAAMYGDVLQEDDVAVAFLEVSGSHAFQECIFVLQHRDFPWPRSFPGETAIANLYFSYST